MFDLDLLYSNKAKAREAIANSDFYNFICDDLIIRAFRLKKIPQKILLIDPPIKPKIESALSAKYTDASIISCFANQISNLQGKFDLILYPFGMHWSIDVQVMLKNIYTRLERQGVLIASFVGEGSLSALQKKLFSLEDKFTNKHFPHFVPFIKFEYMTPLLQQAGYQENIIDIEDIEIEFETPLALMKSLQNYGESNVLKKRGSYSITPEMYRELKMKDKKPFIDYIRVISFICSPQKGTIELENSDFCFESL